MGKKIKVTDEKVPCPVCGKAVKQWVTPDGHKLTLGHKHRGKWCPGGYREVEIKEGEE